MFSKNNSLILFRAGKYQAAPLASETGVTAASYKHKLFGLIACFSLIRLFMAGSLELGNDEAYYWLYSQKLQWNYFDHPPMIALWIRLFTCNLWLQAYELFIRLGSVVGAALASWFLFRTCSLLHSEKAGWYAACLYNASFYAGITAGIYAMPDAPQMVFWTFSLWMIVRITKAENNWKNWLLFGVAAGLCIMSKVHGIFIWLGMFSFILLKKREWLLLPQLYVALFLSAAIASPILIWNIHNHFETYRFHSQRITINKFYFNAHAFFRELFGQFLFNNPFNVILIIAALKAAYQKKFVLPQSLQIFLFAGLPLSVILLLISLFRDTLPHWSGPAYVCLLPVAGVWLAENASKRLAIFPYLALAGHVLILGLLVLFVNYFPGTYGSKTPENYGKGDISLDMYGWQDVGKQFQIIYENDRSRSIIPAQTPVITYKWWAAHQDYYFCRTAGIPLIGLGPVNNLHQYLWMNVIRKNRVNMSQAFCIIPSDENYNFRYWYAPYYDQFTKEATITLFRNHKIARYFYVYRLSGWKNQIPVPQ